MTNTALLRIPEHVDDIAFRSVLAAYTTAYRMLGRQPSVAEVHAYWPRITEQAMAEMIALPEMGEALEGRGITGHDRGLSHLQHTVLLALSDLHDRRSDKAKIEAAGATTKQVTAWMRNPLFAAARRSMAAKGWEDTAPAIKDTMTQQAMAGGFQQQQFILDTLGEGPKAREQQSAREVVTMMVSAIQRATVGHPEIRAAIMEEMTQGMTMMRLTQAGG